MTFDGRSQGSNWEHLTSCPFTLAPFGLSGSTILQKHAPLFLLISAPQIDAVFLPCVRERAALFVLEQL